jgi:uncharacterized protein (DUF1015 family)
MAIIEPFRGIIYSKQKIGNISNVVSPPYDVLTEDDVKQYEKKHEFNVVRLIQSRNGTMGKRKMDRYEMAATYFKQWRKENVLIQDKIPSLYIYEHKFSVNKNEYRRIGFISAVKIEDFSSGRVLPHENTFAGPIEDRFKLTVATKSNLCSIFSIFSDPDGRITELMDDESNKIEIYSAEDNDGGRHILYRISEQNIIKEIKMLMADKVFLIADGHHRYETALRYRDYVRVQSRNRAESAPADYVMMYLTPMESSGLVVLPIYRLIKFPSGLNTVSIIKKSEEYFNVVKLKSVNEALDFLEEKLTSNFKGFVIVSGDAIYVFSLKSPDIMKKFNPGNYSETRLLLNVSVLHLLFVNNILGMDKDESEKNIYYSNNLEELIQKQKQMSNSGIILLNPPTIQEIKTVAENNERMPHKSTFFYPKLLSGLVFRSLEE